MARRKQSNFFSDLAGATLRLSHRVPLIGLIAAAGCALGWWRLRLEEELYWRALAITLAVLGILFGLIAVVGFLRNLFPEAGPGSRRRR